MSSTSNLHHEQTFDITATSTPLDVLDDHGLLIRLHATDTGHSISIECVPDQHYPNIHSNCYAPSDMYHVRLLHGGGSGTAVFGGIHTCMNTIVMKHGGSKDTKEVFSLATIMEELQHRQSIISKQQQYHDNKSIHDVYDDMKKRIPEFVGVYISRHHLRDRGKELWCALRCLTYTPSGKRLSLYDSSNLNTTVDKDDNDILSDSAMYKISKLKPPSETNPPTRSLQVIQGATNDPIHWSVDKTSIVIQLPLIKASNDMTGFDFIKAFGKELQKQEEKYSWKVTLIQKWIGGEHAVNGADILTSGKLQGRYLDILLQEVTTVINDLDLLTLPTERCSHVDDILQEIKQLHVSLDIHSLSKRLDTFVGRSILKNFHPDHGRFRNLRLVGEDLREGDLILTSLERVPANFLGSLLEQDCPLNNIFLDPPGSRTALDIVEEIGWLSILEQATKFNESTFHAATDGLWTCGLTDAGLHNCFLSLERGLELFDLGEPSIEPRPAFLTKFLMSFFHTLGMESDENGSWKNRFILEESNGVTLLGLSSETQEKIPYLHHVFTLTIDHIIHNIFHDDENVRKLLLKYVVLQLLSDASFCLQRWESKGGGSERYGDRKDDALEKWLWRSLWDNYIASYVHYELFAKLDLTL